MVTVYVPTPFRRATNNKDRVTVEAESVGEVLDDLEKTYEGLRGLVRTESGDIHPHVNIYLNSEAIEALEGQGTPVKDGDELTIIPALAGGGASGSRA
jgi:sulfur-carrier protein